MFGGNGRHASAWAGKLLRRHAERCTRRAGDDDAELVWQPVPNGHYVLPVPEGKLVMSQVDPQRGLWNLYMQWGDGHGDKFIVQGARRVIERMARRILRVGPHGGPDFRGQPSKWRHYEDETEHAVASGGGLRLMPPVLDDGDDDDDGVLLLAHNDPNGSVSVLGVGEHDELQDEAELLGRNPGPRVRLSLGGRWRYLQAIGAEGLVGYLELDDDLFVLGHLEGDKFGLAHQSGGVQRGIRTYSLDEVQRGDLGPVPDWSSDASPSPTRETTTWRSLPRDGRVAGQREGAPLVEGCLQGLDLIGALIHLTPEDDITGEAARTLPKFLEGIRGLVQMSVGNKIDWAMGIVRLIREKTGQQIHCCAKIANACLHWIARRTKLVVRRKRKWELLCGDMRRRNSALLRWMIRRGPLDLKPGQRRRAKEVERPSQATHVESTNTTTVAPGQEPAAGSTAPTPRPSPPAEASPSPGADDASSPLPSVPPESAQLADSSPSAAAAPAAGGGSLRERASFKTFSCELPAVATTSATAPSGLVVMGTAVCDQQPSAHPPGHPAMSSALPSPLQQPATGYQENRPGDAVRAARDPGPSSIHRGWPKAMENSLLSPLQVEMSLEAMSVLWTTAVQRWQALLGGLPGPVPAVSLDGLARSGTRPGGGWIRGVSSKRVRGPP